MSGLKEITATVVVSEETLKQHGPDLDGLVAWRGDEEEDLEEAD
jgi:hypothetical protein